MKCAWSIACLLLVLGTGSDAHGQDRPLAQQLLHVDEGDTTSVGHVAPADTTSQQLEATPAEVMDNTATDSTATDYVSPEVGPPGSQRKEQEQMREPPPQKPTRSGVRIGIGLPIGFFFMF